MKEKKIGILCTSAGFGGLEMNTLRLAGWLRADGWKVHLMTAGDSILRQRATDEGWYVTPISEGPLPGKGGQLRALHIWMRRYKNNILFVPYNKDISVASLYKRFYDGDIHLVYQQHMQVGVRKRDFIHTLRYAMIDAWISPLEYLKEETLRKTRVPAAKIHIIPFGLETDSFLHSAWTRESARKTLSLPEGPEMIGVLGRIDPKKGQDLVIEGIHRLQHHYGRDYHLLLLGDATPNEGDAFSRQLQALVRSLGLEDRVHFRAFQPDVMQFFRAIDVFAMPSHGETFGMVTLEAMAARLPIVGTDKDGTKEILQDGKLGYLFPFNDVDGFCRQVIAARENPNAADVLHAAREQVLQHYTKEGMCRKLETLFTSLMEDD